MGELLRRYWMPIGGASELASNPIKPIRLMGEDLVLYKDLGGQFGLLDRHCPHRRADLAYGFVEPTNFLAGRKLNVFALPFVGDERMHNLPIPIVQSSPDVVKGVTASNANRIYDGFVLFGERGALAGPCVRFENITERTLFLENFVYLRDVFRRVI